MMQSFTFFSVLQGRSRHFLKSLGLINTARVKAAAFARLQARLFRLNEVEVVTVQGFAVWGPNRSTSDCEVEVVTSRPSSVLEQEVKRIFLEINLSYDVNMVPLVADRKTISPGTDLSRTMDGTTQGRVKTTANTRTASNQR
jgi:hypothetical protein